VAVFLLVLLPACFGALGRLIRPLLFSVPNFPPLPPAALALFFFF